MTTYPLIAVPLDGAQASASSTSFHISLLATIEFASGSVSAAEVAEAVRRHPLLSRDDASPLQALVMRYADWLGSSRTLIRGAPGVVPLDLRRRGGAPASALRATLLDYLARDRPVVVTPLRHDDAHDRRVAADYLDITGIHDRVTVLRGLLHQRYAASVPLATDFADLTDRSLAFARRRAVASQVQARLIELLAGELQVADAGLGPQGGSLVSRVRKDVAALTRRLDPGSSPAASEVTALRTLAAAMSTPSDLLDPNASVHAALSNGLIARECGIVTEWVATTSGPLVGDFVIAIDPASLPRPATVVARTTAFRRADATAPLAFVDAGGASTGNGCLAALSDDKGRPRYSCTGVNAEASAIQATLLQAGNSPSNGGGAAAASRGRRRDDRPPVELADQHFGFNELEAVGLTISAPAEDLITPEALKSQTREQDLPCLFLEDLWIGYRLDLAPLGGGASLRSVHRQRQRIRFAKSGRIIEGETEDFWPREPGSRGSGPVSNEIIRFDGLSAPQRIDLARMLGDYRPPPAVPGAPFTVSLEGCSGVTPLRFSTDYRYRLRTVFQGGIGLSEGDPGIADPDGRHLQTASYRRARSYRPGEILVTSSEDGKDRSNDVSVFLSETARSRTLLVAPCPVDMDTARYNGQFLAGRAEATLDHGRMFVTDLPAFMAAQGRDASYYCDPEVSAISIELWVRNGDPHSAEREFRYQTGTYCELVEPLHVGPVVAVFGSAGRWRDFRPIELLFSTTRGVDAGLSVTSRGRRVRIKVPRYADVEVVLTPVLPADRVTQTASFAPVTSVGAEVRSAGVRTDFALPVVEHRIRVVHCVGKPAQAPRLVSEGNLFAPGGEAVAVLDRELLSDRVQLVGYVEVDAPSSGEVELEASWSEIDDDPMHERYVLRASHAVSKPRSVAFSAASATATVSLAQGFAAKLAAFAASASDIGKQCAENRVFMGGARPAEAVEGAALPVDLPLGSTRRVKLDLVARARSRYASRFPSVPPNELASTSRSLQADAPASMVLPVPLISHAIPLVRQSEGVAGGRRTRKRTYAMRVYVQRPWCVSGPGERLAIACHAGPLSSGQREEIDRSFTQWGQDPLARSASEATRRLPRASDFRAGAGQRTLDPAVYAANSPEGNAAVLYVDDVVRDRAAGDAGETRLSLASFALSWDQVQRLWFCDIMLAGDFAGWIALALYRHQPHAHEGYQLSGAAAFVYSRVLEEESVTWFRQAGELRVSIGPVFDSAVGFAAERRLYHDGVSLDHVGPGGRLPFREFQVNGRRYFEGIFDVGEEGVEVIRRRLGSDISSFNVR